MPLTSPLPARELRREAARPGAFAVACSLLTDAALDVPLRLGDAALGPPWTGLFAGQTGGAYAAAVPAVTAAWQRVRDAASALETGLWAEAAAARELTQTFTATVVEFQCGQTPLQTEDELSLGWGALAYQAAVAAENSIWCVRAWAAGLPESESGARQFEHVRATLQHWLTPAAPQPPARPGDLVLAHFFVAGLTRWHERVVAMCVRETEAEVAAWSGPARAGQPRRARRREAALQRAQERLRLARAAHAESGRLLAGWAAMDALLPAEPRPTAPASVPASPLSLTALFDDAGAGGLRWWLVRAAARRLALRGAALPLEALISRWFQAAAAVEPPAPATDPRRTEWLPATSPGWRAWTWLLDFYVLWVRSSDAPESVRAAIVEVPEEQQEALNGFFAPLDTALELAARATSLPGAPGSPAGRFREAALRAAPWRDALLALVDHFLRGGVRVRVESALVEPAAGDADPGSSGEYRGY